MAYSAWIKGKGFQKFSSKQEAVNYCRDHCIEQNHLISMETLEATAEECLDRIKLAEKAHIAGFDAGFDAGVLHGMDRAAREARRLRVEANYQSKFEGAVMLKNFILEQGGSKLSKGILGRFLVADIRRWIKNTFPGRNEGDV